MLRTMDLQIKNGYLLKVPEEYEFLKRYPPVSRDKPALLKTIKTQNIPYGKYYDKVLAKNPDLIGEHVYPAYWRQQPLALILAKKQYEFVQKGLSEEEAYKKAVECVDIEESKSYDKMKEVHNHIEKTTQAKASFTSDPKLSQLVDAWRAKLQKVPYENLTLAEQGEIDFLIQTMILKWNEVERERRMKDPIYYMQFHKLRSTIFPQIDTVKNIDKENHRKNDFMINTLTFSGLDHRLLTTKAPFFYEDYLSFFSKLKHQPLLTKWTSAEQQHFSKYIINVLAYRHIMENPEGEFDPTATVTRTEKDEESRQQYIQNYVDSIRGQFFPMVQYPDRASEFNAPSPDEFKQLLYDRDIGE